ncbi:ARS binding protein 2-domain-containing protein [Staphylotrichum tortipilum]|uniref:ARS binding protein 2-domain-containing protein n=1 Tax=Staphylotrichum tortipilum TaxID=2831512 RepID=A0AAN6MVK9_9PEZI|nr:ARS binding protein 2-domain-containing protein [Staphylotrichum longicolle]
MGVSCPAVAFKPSSQCRRGPAQPPSPRRALPDRTVDGTSIEDAFVAFILACNPGVPPDTDTAALRDAFRTPPKSGGKSFSTFTLFELIKKLETKELKTWAELALKLGVEPPDQEKGQSSQRIQQYAVRLKRWMHSMHVDAFFDYLMGRQSLYWTEIPSEQIPIAELERDGVAAEDDMALRALLPQIKPRRGRRKPDEEETGKSPSQRPSPQADEYGGGGRPELMEPWTAQPDGRGSVFLFPPVPDPSKLNPSGPTWTNDIVQTPMTAYPIPQSAITPSTRNAFWADEPKFPSPTPDKNAPSNDNSAPTGPADPTTAPQSAPTPAATAAPAPPPPQPPVQPVQHPNTLSPIQESAPPRPAKRSRLSLQVPERVGGEVRLATPPLPTEQTVTPVLMVNGQATEPRADQTTNSNPPSTLGTFVAPSLSAGVPVPGEQTVFSPDPTDRTHMDEIEALFVSSILRAEWYDAENKRISPCGVEEAWAFAQRVVENLLKSAPTKEAFLINLSALAGGKILMPKSSLRITRFEDLPDRTRYRSNWQLRFGGIMGNWAMEETVMHDKWKKPKKDEKTGPDPVAPNGTSGSQADHWEKKYKELAATLQQRDEEMMRLRAKYVVCGRPVPRLGTRHISLLFVTLSALALFSLLFTLPGSAHAGPRLKAAGHKLSSLPTSLRSPWLNKLNPFKQPSHAPHRQTNDTDGDSWCSVTLDENRALLPMLRERTPIYCYYDSALDKDPSSRDAESDLLLAWRRACPAEAMNNPLYEELQRLQDMTPALKTELMRWLAWENMGDGVLARHLLFPMGPHDDPLLTFLRRGEYPKLTRFKNLDDGLFIGSKGEVAATIKAAMASPQIKKAEDITAVVADKKENPFAVDDSPKALSYYSARQIESLAAGLKSLTQLINAHLHLTWQNIFTDGISVVKPLPQHTTYLIAPAYELAQRLAHCPENPLPSSCPPNRSGCRPCDDSKPMKITTPSSYSDSRTLYTIGTTQLSIPWIRRESPRDAWIASLTASLFPDKISTTPRLIRFKEAVASDESPDPKSKSGGTKGGAFRSLWLSAEQPALEDADWHFGFALPDRATYADTPPTTTTTDANTNINLPPLHSEKDGPLPSKTDLLVEPEILHLAQSVITQTSASGKKPAPLKKEDLALRDASEAWNLADTEAWRFARAYAARAAVERRRWEEEEARYAGGMGSERMGRKISSKKEKEREKELQEKEGADEERDKEKGGQSSARKAFRGAWDRWMDRD